MTVDEGAPGGGERKKTHLFSMLSSMGSQGRADYWEWLGKEPKGREHAIKTLNADFPEDAHLADFFSISVEEVRALRPKEPERQRTPSFSYAPQREMEEKPLLRSIRALPERDRIAMLTEMLDDLKRRENIYDISARALLAEKLGLSPKSDEFLALFQEEEKHSEEHSLPVIERTSESEGFTTLAEKKQELADVVAELQTISEKGEDAMSQDVSSIEPINEEETGEPTFTPEREEQEEWWFKNRMAWEVLAIAAEEPPLDLGTATKIIAKLSMRSRRGRLRSDSLSHYFHDHTGSSVLGSEAVRTFIEEKKSALPPLSPEELADVRNLVGTMRKELFKGPPSSRRATPRREPTPLPVSTSADVPEVATLVPNGAERKTDWTSNPFAWAIIGAALKEGRSFFDIDAMLHSQGFFVGPKLKGGKSMGATALQGYVYEKIGKTRREVLERIDAHLKEVEAQSGRTLSEEEQEYVASLRQDSAQNLVASRPEPVSSPSLSEPPPRHEAEPAVSEASISPAVSFEVRPRLERSDPNWPFYTVRTGFKSAHDTKSAITFKELVGINEREVTDPVSATKYVELYKAGKLDWQIKKIAPPSHYPLLEEAEEEAEYQQKRR